MKKTDIWINFDVDRFKKDPKTCVYFQIAEDGHVLPDTTMDGLSKLSDDVLSGLTFSLDCIQALFSKLSNDRNKLIKKAHKEISRITGDPIPTDVPKILRAKKPSKHSIRIDQIKHEPD